MTRVSTYPSRPFSRLVHISIRDGIGPDKGYLRNGFDVMSGGWCESRSFTGHAETCIKGPWTHARPVPNKGPMPS